MTIIGKIIGGILGFLVANIPGLLIGIWIGHSFDKGLNQDFGRVFDRADPTQIQKVFFETSFAVMGHLAKADGTVTEKEIAAAEDVMRKLGLNADKRKEAISAFNRGKSNDFDLNLSLRELLTLCSRRPSLIQMFLEIQILAATADGQASGPEMEILYQIGYALGISSAQIDQLINMVHAQQSFHRDGHTGNYTVGSKPSLEQAYQVLGIPATANKAETKRAYRKLMSQHHPDKLVSRGMPEEMVKVATEKSQEIQSAYEMIKKQKGF